MGPDAVILQNFVNLILGFGYATVFITFVLFVACGNSKKGHVATKGRIEGVKLVENAKLCEVISSGYRPQNPHPLGTKLPPEGRSGAVKPSPDKRIITEGKMIKGGINRKEMTERPKTSPPSLHLRKR